MCPVLFCVLIHLDVAKQPSISAATERATPITTLPPPHTHTMDYTLRPRARIKLLSLKLLLSDTLVQPPSVCK